VRDDERAMLRSSLRRLLAETDAAKVPTALDEFGWNDLLANDPSEAVPALFEAQGEALVASPMLNVVMAAPLLAAAGEPAGEWAVLLPGPGRNGRPGAVSCAGGLDLAGYGLAAGGPVGRVLVIAGADDGALVLARVDGRGEGRAVVHPLDGADPWLGLVRLEGRVPAGSASVDGLAPEGVVAAWEASVAAGRRALAHELIGLSRAMLGQAVEHAGTRHQFGRPIGSFQAVKHRLADAKVALSAAEAAADEAWVAPGPLTALLAKLWAGRAARAAGKQAQQVLGGMGFTWEHPFHRHFRRALVLDSLLGSATEMQSELGRSLLATGEVPRLATL
jgi:hypothetical protein